MSDGTVALRAVRGFNALSKNDVIHVPLPLDPHYAALVKMGMLADDNGILEPVEQVGQILTVSELGDETTILGVMPAPGVANPARKRGRPKKIQVTEVETTDGEADPESA